MWSPTWIGERLRAEGMITASQLAAAAQAMQLYNERMEEALMRIGALDEAKLLRFVAERCRTQFVSTAKLSRLQVTDQALKFLSERTAEKLLAFPVRYEADSDTLSIVSPDAGDPEYRKQLAFSIKARAVKAYVARPAAVKAAIAKWYKGEIQAFAPIAPDEFQFGASFDLEGKRPAEEESARQLPQPPPQFRGNTSQPGPAPGQRKEFFATPLPHVPQQAVEHIRTPDAWRRPATQPDPTLSMPGPPMPGHLTPPEPPSPPPVLEPPPPPKPPSAPAAAPSAPSPAGDEDRLKALAELLNVLVTLNENTRDEFRGHSASVVRLSKMMMERMGLEEEAQLHGTIAANIHDLGKPVSYHLTALNVAQYDTHRRAAQKLVYTPQRLVESVGFPIEATGAVSGMYERFDGNGFPGRLQGKAIPLGARVLALCDTYSDLTLNPRNLFRKELSREEAQKVLEQYSGKLFDPDLLELLAQLVVGEDLRRRLGDDKQLVLVVEPDPEEATILELRLVAQGFEVKVARAADQALRIAESGNVRYVLCEVDLQPFDGFELLQRMRKNEATRHAPFIFVAKASDASAVDRAFSLGAKDYVVKPTTGDVLAGKLRRLQAPQPKNDVATGVAGSLRDLALPDLVQILFHGRKSGRVKVDANGREGELHFQEGRLVHALIDDLSGEEAVYEMLTFLEGAFSLDPSFKATESTIQANPEMVILEGLRRLDERNRKLLSS